MMAQGEMKDALPSYVHLKNPYFSTESVLTEEGRRDMMKTVLRKFIQMVSGLKKQPICFACGNRCTKMEK